MYIVELYNDENAVTIHGLSEKLKEGKVVKGINTIDSFTFTMLPDNAGFNLISEFKTHITVYNPNKDRYEFVGRVLYAETSMSEDGLISKQVVCESLLGYLCDSWQEYTRINNWTVEGLLRAILNKHNALVEDHKRIHVGDITVEDANNNIYEAILRENTWDAIRTRLIEKLDGELRLRRTGASFYLDYLTSIGEEKDTAIALSENMKSITREQDPTEYVTRLIPLGCKLSIDGAETEVRLDISSITDGRNYIDDEEAIALYGIHTKIEIWDDITTPEMLRLRANQWMRKNNRVNVKYTVTALDLSLLGKVIDDFDVGNIHPIKNALLGIDDKARITKKTIDVCEETKSTIEFGDTLKTLTDIQREQAAAMKQAKQNAETLSTNVKNSYDQLVVDYTAAIELKAEELEEDYTSKIEQLADSITLEISGSLGSEASIILSAGANERSYSMDLSQVRQAFANDSTAISITAGLITFNAGTLIINSSKFTLDASGGITATDAVIYGDIITVDGKYMTEMDKGSLRLYYDDILCGTINTKYWSNASSQGISLRAEEGGKYIMFSHADDTQGSGYVVDYYLNAGWSDNYDEMHIFQTSARFLDDAYFAGKTRIRSLRLFGSDGEYLVGIGSSGNLTVSKL